MLILHIFLSTGVKLKLSSIVNVCPQRQHTFQSQIPPTLHLQHHLPHAQIHNFTPHLTLQWVVDIQTCGSENEMLTHLLLFHCPPLGLLMAHENTWTMEFSLSPTLSHLPGTTTVFHCFYAHCRIIKKYIYMYLNYPLMIKKIN